ncbi:MAG TPA: hypothetical protein EYG38_11750 [Verrucomicrobia bacterium]|nr:hypothetical protein [Verrucomicrobiota bacterium]
MLSVEGVNKSAISRVKKIAWNTVHRWIERAGESCRNYSNKTLKGFEIKELQADELCTFVGNKKKAIWIFTAMDCDGSGQAQLLEHVRTTGASSEKIKRKQTPTNRDGRI